MISSLNFAKLDSSSVTRLTGTAVAGIALNAESSATPITYGMTLDFVADTYTYWIGTPSSGAGTWSNRFAAHTGPLTSLGGTAIDSVQWTIGNQSAGNVFVLDQVEVSFTAIPEPSASAALIGLGVVGLVVLRRRRKA